MSAINDLLEALEVARKRELYGTLRTWETYGDSSDSPLGVLVDAAVAEWRKAQADTKQIRHLATLRRGMKAALKADARRNQ